MKRNSLLGAMISAALVALVGCATGPPHALLQAADRTMASGNSRRALEQYDAIADSPKASPQERVTALVGAARACDLLQDRAGAIDRLERATEQDVPGATEPAYFFLAEHVRDADRPRALNLYYRAAAGAEKNRFHKWPYQAAMDRIVEMSMAR